MNEKQEIKIKKSLMDFINKEIVITGEPSLVADRKHELVHLIFSLFIEFKKYTDKLDKLDKKDTQ